jgi:hypothetical protein
VLPYGADVGADALTNAINAYNAGMPNAGLNLSSNLQGVFNNADGFNVANAGTGVGDVGATGTASTSGVSNLYDKLTAPQAASITNPFGLSKLANTGASVGAGLLGQHIWGGGEGAAGAMTNALGAMLGPVGAFVAPLIGNTFFTSDLAAQPLRNPITGKDAQPGTPEYNVLTEWYQRNESAPQAINTYNYSPEDQARLADAFSNPSSNVGSTVSGITQGATGITYNPMTREELAQKLGQIQPTGGATGGSVEDISHYAQGGIASLPEYAAGGKFLRGPGDGMSDNIRANINGEQEARLADGEFVVPADVVSHIGNGSSEAGSRKLYEMMDKIRVARTGRKAQGKQINPDKFLPD